MTSPSLLTGVSRLIEAVDAPDSETILDSRTSAALDAVEMAYVVEMRATDGSSEGQQASYAHDGQEYIIIMWDWKAEVPVEDIYQAVRRGFIHGGWVPNVPTDDKVIIASQTAEFDAQAVYDAFENDPSVWGGEEDAVDDRTA